MAGFGRGHPDDQATGENDATTGPEHGGAQPANGEGSVKSACFMMLGILLRLFQVRCIGAEAKFQAGSNVNWFIGFHKLGGGFHPVCDFGRDHLARAAPRCPEIQEHGSEAARMSAVKLAAESMSTRGTRATNSV